MNPNREKTISIVQSHGCSTSNLIAILQDIQAACSYLSEESLTVVAEMLDVSVSSVYSVATFYENFSLEAKGKHVWIIDPSRWWSGMKPLEIYRRGLYSVLLNIIPQFFAHSSYSP